jgi:hypothetical protein
VATWRDVLYHGPAATLDGAHLAEGAGQFRILANEPDRSIAYRRRATDEVSTPSIS